MAAPCSHLPSDLAPPEVLTPAGCTDCLRDGTRDWVHLRLCQACGHVGCCDNSPGRHATAHASTEPHPLIRSYEPGEDWWFCYADEAIFVVDGAPPAPSHG